MVLTSFAILFSLHHSRPDVIAGISAGLFRSLFAFVCDVYTPCLVRYLWYKFVNSEEFSYESLENRTSAFVSMLLIFGFLSDDPFVLLLLSNGSASGPSWSTNEIN